MTVDGFAETKISLDITYMIPIGTKIRPIGWMGKGQLQQISVRETISKLLLKKIQRDMVAEMEGEAGNYGSVLKT